MLRRTQTPNFKVERKWGGEDRRQDDGKGKEWKEWYGTEGGWDRGNVEGQAGEGMGRNGRGEEVTLFGAHHSKFKLECKSY